MPTLCRLGNADHGAHNRASATQMWRRMLNIKTEEPSMTDTQWLQRAKLGNSEEQGQLAESMISFVKSWSGGLGEDAYLLIAMEDFERRSKVRRNLSNSLFNAFAQLPVNRFNKRWIQAMLKSSITATREYVQDGYLKDSEVLGVAKGLQTRVEEAIRCLDAVDTYMKENVMHKELPAMMDKLDRIFLCSQRAGAGGISLADKGVCIWMQICTRN